MPGAAAEQIASLEVRMPGLLRTLRDDVACVKARDPAARFTLEILLTYPGVHAVLLHRLANRLWKAGARFPARLLSWFARLTTNVDIHPGATIGRRFFIDHGAGVVIGETAEVGDDVTLYHGVTLGGTSWSPGKRHPTLRDGVLVGAGAKILGPIEVGANARVGANSVVIEDVPPGMTVVGIPGKVVRDPRERRRLAHGRIDLEHHLMPDPVGQALSALLDRIDFLEARVAHLQRPRRGEAVPGCDICDEGKAP
ncbi:serine O-acetyltransferase [Paracraurococcus lichenis]|uniref:serine O-acetyltransferase n=1 Tax=Paracraurococcus lichenis TaxID=3064888 RepID=A0ABT9E1H6_9PROT|nr:serine O-acetyltransferase [Paracraurococcus sp. LOR1-02]MDO9709875.1 serine O-acetyltransferase [Paracraurococcus sp. LOR1-02]